MNQPLRLFLITLLALTITFAFNFFFLNLFERPLIDQILLTVFSTTALGYLIFSFLGSAAISDLPAQVRALKTKFTVASLQIFVRENLYGILLALVFFGIYTFIGLKLNSSTIDTVDNFLDADNYSWM